MSLSSFLPVGRGRFLLAVAILAFVLVGVQVSIGWRRLFDPWFQMGPSTLLLALSLTMVGYFARALRNYDYFLPLTRGGFAICLKLTLLHNLLNNVLPMRTGEGSFPVLMKRYFCTPLSRSIAALLWFRVMDLHALGAVALVTIGDRWMTGPALFGAMSVWLVLPLGLLRLQSSGFASTFLDKLPYRWRGRFAEASKGLPQNANAFWRAWFWTVVNWFVKLAVFAWILQLFTPMSFAAAIAGAIGGDLTSVLPIHGIAGVGTYEAGVVAALLPFSVRPEEAVIGAINLHLFLLGSSAVAGGLALFVRNRVVDADVAEESRQ